MNIKSINYNQNQSTSRNISFGTANRKAIGKMTPQRLQAAANRLRERISNEHYITATDKKHYEILARIEKRIKEIYPRKQDGSIEQALDAHRTHCHENG